MRGIGRRVRIRVPEKSDVAPREIVVGDPEEGTGTGVVKINARGELVQPERQGSDPAEIRNRGERPDRADAEAKGNQEAKTGPGAKGIQEETPVVERLT